MKAPNALICHCFTVCRFLRLRLSLNLCLSLHGVRLTFSIHKLIPRRPELICNHVAEVFQILKTFRQGCGSCRCIYEKVSGDGLSSLFIEHRLP